MNFNCCLLDCAKITIGKNVSAAFPCATSHLIPYISPKFSLALYLESTVENHKHCAGSSTPLAWA